MVSYYRKIFTCSYYILHIILCCCELCICCTFRLISINCDKVLYCAFFINFLGHVPGESDQNVFGLSVKLPHPVEAAHSVA